MIKIFLKLIDATILACMKVTFMIKYKMISMITLHKVIAKMICIEDDYDEDDEDDYDEDDEADYDEYDLDVANNLNVIAESNFNENHVNRKK
jgi:hypothetical protein